MGVRGRRSGESQKQRRIWGFKKAGSSLPGSQVDPGSWKQLYSSEFQHSFLKINDKSNSKKCDREVAELDEIKSETWISLVMSNCGDSAGKTEAGGFLGLSGRDSYMCPFLPWAKWLTMSSALDIAYGSSTMHSTAFLRRCHEFLLPPRTWFCSVRLNSL